MPERRRLVPMPFGDDPDHCDAVPNWVLLHETEHRSHLAWLRDTFASRSSA